jgi:hypothetical protein
VLRKLLPARVLGAAVAVAAAITTAGATGAQAAPQLQTLTVLNTGQNLAVRDSRAVTENPQVGVGAQRFELLFPGSAGDSEPGFGSAFQLRNSATGKCLRDAGSGNQVSEVTCFANPAVNSTQLWQQHIFADRSVGGKDYFHLYNRHTDLVLTRAPQFGAPVAVITSPAVGNTGSAGAALQLWHFTRV